MHRTKIIYYIIFTNFLIGSCIEAFDPILENDGEKQYVVYGQILNVEGYQKVYISYSTSLDKYWNEPVTDCIVRVLDDKGNEFLLEERRDGEYRVWMGQEHLTSGTSYKVEIETPLGDLIESDYDIMIACPEIESIYSGVENIPTSNPGEFSQGVQFYVDFNGENSDCNFVRWELEETWEYHSFYPIENYKLNGFDTTLRPPDYSKFYAWKSGPIEDIFVLSTKNLIENAYKKFPLHFAENKVSRFEHCYSLLVTQYSLSEAAYIYFDQLKSNNKEQGGLYISQPIVIKGNLYNTTNPEHEVIGLFHSSSRRRIRVFFTDMDVKLIDEYHCLSPTYIPPDPGLPINGGPFYYLIKEDGAKYSIAPECVDCLLLGGTTEKPDYWPY